MHRSPLADISAENKIREEMSERSFARELSEPLTKSSPCARRKSEIPECDLNCRLRKAGAELSAFDAIILRTCSGAEKNAPFVLPELESPNKATGEAREIVEKK